MIKLENVNFKYKSGKEVLRNINIEIREGEFISIIGKNGSGKSTLAKIISGLEYPSKGQCLIDDINTKDKNKFKEIRKKIGIVFQNPENQILFNNVYDDICFAIKNLDLANEKERVENALKKVNMEDFINCETYELSLGQKQRITIAGVIALNTKYIVMDEPTSMIDPIGKEKIYDVIKELKKSGYTIIYATNLIDEILMTDKTIIIENGKIIKEFLKDNILDQVEFLKEHNIKIPEKVELIYELKKEGIQIDIEEWSKKEITKKIIGALKNEKNS